MAIADALNAYEAQRWPLGKIPGGQGLAGLRNPVGKGAPQRTDSFGADVPRGQ